MRPCFQSLVKLAKHVSVPLPGFSGLRPGTVYGMARSGRSFSPVAGIQWVETLADGRNWSNDECFSPVAGIQWVET